jgi:glycerate-2-kinase
MWVCGGETTVRATGKGLGGRNQELALRVMMRLGGVTLRPWLCVCLGTDGVDGPTDAAGAFVSDRTWAAARERGLDVGAAIRRNDSHGLLRRLERAGTACLIRTGPTGTNVADVMVMMVF